MNRRELNTNWNFKIIGDNVYGIAEEYMPATVPGSVYGNLLLLGKMPDPFYRDNELDALKLMDNNCAFCTEFELSEEDLNAPYKSLVFEGIDTLAEIYLNGTLIGEVDNMYRTWEFSLDELGKLGTNTLKIVINSPTRYIKEENEKVYTGGAHECMSGFPHLRKCHCMFGWDWGPRLPDMGIFRPVYLVTADEARLESVYINQIHDVTEYAECETLNYHGQKQICKYTKSADVTLDFDVCIELLTEKAMNSDDERIAISVIAPDGELYEIHDADKEGFKILIPNAKLWWPNGYGEQNLYKVSVTLYNRLDEILDSWERRIGLRTMTVNTEADEWGNSFAHEVNGLSIFAMGADYIPEDNIFMRINPQRTRKLLEDAAAAHHNVIRVWGGGYYPEDYFYDICDELGIIVWQDFMYACASYELDEKFEENIKAETVDNVRRLRHHASLGLWCGNNEMETQVLDGAWEPSTKQKYDYIKLYEYIIPKIVKEEDPQTFYWPSSPSAGGNYDNPWNENVGDAHYWDVWHGEKPFTDYRKYFFRYLSEFGFQSFPCIQTIKSFTEPEDRNIFSRVMEMHQRNVAANGKIMKYMGETYLYPTSFEMLLYASQLLQLDAIRYGVEHFRRHRGRCMGSVVWQLNDIWPVASWASIDYYGRWKALHYAEVKMFSPVMISCEENGEINLRPHCIEEPHEIVKTARINVSNETIMPVEGDVIWSLNDPDSNVLKEGREHICVPALSSYWLDTMDFSDGDELSMNLSFSFVVNGEIVSENSCIFTAPKAYRYSDPELSYRVEGDDIIVSSKAFAMKVMIDNEEGDLKLSDNYFDMQAGEKRIRIIEGTPQNISLHSVYDIR